MKSAPCLRGSVLALVLVAGCAHQTRIETDPPGAEVYVNGERVGVAPVEFEDEGGWSREYEITLKKDGYDLKQTTLEQSEFNVPVLVAAGVCGLCTCGLGALYFVPRSRHLEDRYRYLLKRKEPLPPLAPPEPSLPAEPAPNAPAPADPSPDAPAPDETAPAPSPAAMRGLDGETKAAAFRY